MIDPTREEWLSARERALALWPLAAPGDTHWDKVVVAILGPCPPEPPPEPWSAGNHGVTLTAYHSSDGTVVCVSMPRRIAAHLTPDEADAMAAALTEHAAYAREQGTAT